MLLTSTTRRATAVLVAVLAALAALTVLPSTPARADDVQSAQHRVDALQQVARDTTAKLTAGTRRWEADQKRLRQVQQDLRNTQRRIAVAQAQLAERQAKVALVARQLFMSPTPSGMQLAVTRTPDEVLDALQVQQGVNVSAGSQAQVIARARTAALRLRDQEQQSRDLVRSAAALTKASAQRLADLQALAARTSAQLTSAQDALDRALAARAARAAAAKAARDRARAAALARAARNRVPVFRGGGGATCSSRSTSGQANGNLDPASLCPLWMAPGHRLRSDAAAAFNRMSQYHAKTAGSPLCVTDSYRSYSEQVSVYQRKPGLAAVPGTSNHGWGLAVDFCGGVQSAGSPAYRWMKANAGRFGWHHPAWAEPGGSKPEAWHWEFGG